jgi:serine protease Do
MNVFPRMLCAVLLLAGTGAKAAPMPPSLADLAAHVLPAVVSIASTDPVTDNSAAGDGGGGGDDNGNNGDDGSAYHPTADTSGTVIPPPKAVEALGSGFVFDPAGYIVTNNHVIDGATSISVTFQDGTILPAVIVGRDKAADLAVLKVNAGQPLPYLKFGNSDKLRVGDWVLAIGNPFGLPGSASSGIVSALNRNIHSGNYDDFIQTDATINRGNSGGPLFDMNGNVIGVNSAIYSPSGGSDGIGFAIPSAMVAPVAQALKTTGSMTRGWLGTATEEVTPEIQHLLGLPAASGALIGAVAPGSPAAGKLQPGDVLVALGGVPITDPRSLLIRTAEIPTGQTAVAQYWRDGAQGQVTLRLAVPPAAVDDIVTQPAPAAPANFDLSALGLSVAAKPLDDGLSVVAATGPSAKAGIVAGDVIEQISGVTVASAADLQKQVQLLGQSHTPVAVLLVSGDAADGADPGPRWVPVSMP